jgi:F-type H+-transporting ATPase subunit alpha
MSEFSQYLEQIGEYGVVREVKHPLAVAFGIPHAKPNEIVVFESGQRGEVFSVEHDLVKILVFSKEPVKAGAQLVRTDKFLSVPVGDELLGAVIDPLGNPLLASHPLPVIKEEREIEGKMVPMEDRLRITKPLLSGVTLVDLMVPLGKGQRELVIGDRKTGKTAFLISTMKYQIAEGSLCIYAAVGKKKSDIRKQVDDFDKEGILKKMIFIGTSSYDSPSLTYLAPYAAMSIAEYFRDKGKDVLLILDDLSTHAKFYREIGLLSGFFPGRDSYPGDIFYAHARLVERAGNFKHPTVQQVAITCLPVVEIVEGDLTGHIATNIMGMTDGHIFFDSNAYYKGRRPAINISLSVTRVGRQTQTKLKRAINHELSAFLSEYEKMQNFSHFGAELSAKVKNILRTGEKLYDFFDQHLNISMPEAVQIVMFALIWTHYFNDQTTDYLNAFREKLLEVYKDPKNKEILDAAVKLENFDDLLSFIAEKKDQIVALCKVDSP